MLTLDQLKALLGDDTLTEETAAAALTERFKGLSTQVTDLETQLEAAEGKTSTMAASRTVDPDVLDGLAETAEDGIDNLVSLSKISPAVAKNLKSILVGPASGRNAYALSRQVSGTEQSVAKAIITALKENDVVKLGESTKGQAMSRVVPGGSDTAADPDTTKRMIEMAGGAAK